MKRKVEGIPKKEKERRRGVWRKQDMCMRGYRHHTGIKEAWF